MYIDHGGHLIRYRDTLNLNTQIAISTEDIHEYLGYCIDPQNGGGHHRNIRSLN